MLETKKQNIIQKLTIKNSMDAVKYVSNRLVDLNQKLNGRLNDKTNVIRFKPKIRTTTPN